MPLATVPLQVWDLREGQLFYTLHGHEGATYGVDFSPAGDFFASAGADEQVLVWRSNFDRVMSDYVLASVQPNPRLATTYPTAEVTTASARPATANLTKASLKGLEGGGGAGPPAGRTRSPPRQPQSASTCVRMGPQHKVQCSPSAARPLPFDTATEHCDQAKLDPVLDRAQQHSGAQQGTVHQQEDVDDSGLEEMFIPPPMNLADLPPALSATLQHIVGQLDVLTQTMGLLEERLTISEDKMHRLDKGLQMLRVDQMHDQSGSPKLHAA